ncbi:hypothetical protein O181_110950 [Austropuccinia psidii MF-1]|uniref:Uncharacterized protein n=1 Tax=Austropuccinia psidii MF-1 TaxID=1389203 RepID=A0A9Q3PS23_9BASI|nr:hypothetical protein [Austropuccinia psidii MF-1]
MFDFLIDVVPAEHPPPSQNPMALSQNPSLIPSTSNYKRRHMSSELSSNPIRKKKFNSRVNRNLPPQEVAIPIFNEEDVQSAFVPSPRQRAVPIPDSELIGPPSRPWEMAVPITRDSNLMVADWEMAVPLSSSSQNCLADHTQNSMSPNPAQLSGLSEGQTIGDLIDEIIQDEIVKKEEDDEEELGDWEKAVPVTETDYLNNNHPENSESWERAVPILTNQAAGPSGPSSWELAVPITPFPDSNLVSSHSTGSECQFNQIRLGSHGLVPIDPLLCDDLAVKLEPASDEEEIPPSSHGDVFIKQEE